MIEIITSGGSKLLDMPEGGHIKLIYNNGDLMVRTCSRINDEIILVGERRWMITEFADFVFRECATWEHVKMPEKVNGYIITDRATVGKTDIAVGENMELCKPYATWQRVSGSEKYGAGRYFLKRFDALNDYTTRMFFEQQAFMAALVG